MIYVCRFSIKNEIVISIYIIELPKAKEIKVVAIVRRELMRSL